LLAAVLAGTSLARPASAEDLKEALIAAYEGNPELAAARASLRALDEDVAKANAGWRPTLTGNGSVNYGDTENTLNTTTTNYNSTDRNAAAQLSQPLFTGFRTTNQVNVARKTVFAGRERVRQTEIGVLFDTVTAYMDVKRDEAVQGLNQNQVDVLERQLKATKDRFEVGELTRTDVAQSEARLADAVTNRFAAEGQLTASRESYRKVVGRAPGTLDQPPALPGLPESVDRAVEIALKSSPVVGSARFNVDAAHSQVALAKSALWPTIDAVGGINYSRGQTPFGFGAAASQERFTKSIGATLRIPFYQAGAEYAEIRRALQVESQRRMELSAAERQVEEQVRNAWEQLRTARSSIESSQTAVNSNEIALEGVRQEATVGSRTILDVLDAEQEALNARVGLVKARRNEFVAGIGLLAAMGQLDTNVFELGVKTYDPTVHYDAVRGRIFGW